MLERLPWIIQLLLAAMVLTAGYFDLRYRRIPNWLTLPGFLVGLALNAFLSFRPGQGLLLRNAALGLALAMLVYFPLYLLRGMGAGDVKLMAAIGSLVGWRDWLAIFVFSGIIGGVLAVVLMLAKGRMRKTLYNTGHIVWEMVHLRAPHLRSEELDVSNPRAFTLPHGAVIALGALALLGLHALLPSQ
jgi:prepilin peptidase CpaA